MSELEKEAKKYAEPITDGDDSKFRKYAIVDFIAGANWQKLKQNDMVEILQKVSDYLKEHENTDMHREFSGPIDDLIKQATKLWSRHYY